MAKVFVVTQGEYSAYHIVGIFTSREKALESCPAAASGTDARLEEFELDRIPKDEEGFLQDVFYVCLGPNGDLTHSMSEAEWLPANYCKVDHTDKDGVFEIYAHSVVSEEHALKLAAEHRQALLRQNA